MTFKVRNTSPSYYFSPNEQGRPPSSPETISSSEVLDTSAEAHEEWYKLHLTE